MMAEEGEGMPSPSSTLSDIQTKIGAVEDDIKGYKDKLAQAERDKNKVDTVFYRDLLLENTKRLAGLEQRLAGLEQDAREARKTQQNQGKLFVIYCWTYFSLVLLFALF